MRTKTNFTAVQELMAVFTPAQRGIISDQEACLVHGVLELGRRDGLELDDIRDAAVMLYGQTASQIEKEKGAAAMMAMMDAMSAVTAVIDQEKAARQSPGCQVNTYPDAPMYAVSAGQGTEFLTPSHAAPFSTDPRAARKWQDVKDAQAMAAYAASQYHRQDLGIVRIESMTATFPLRAASKGGASDE